MPWSDPLDQKRQFVREALTGEYSMTELCERYGISRNTGYTVLARWRAQGELGLVPRSHATKSCPHKTEAAVVEELLIARRKHPLWGARKLLDWLVDEKPHLARRLPSASTAADILKRHGLVPDRRRRRFRPPVQNGLTVATRPNHVWTADFKGEFPTLDRIYCFPLTIADDFSRFLLECEGKLSTSGALAKPVFTQVFREYGLPDIMRTDNGGPFASTALARLSKLSV